MYKHTVIIFNPNHLKLNPISGISKNISHKVDKQFSLSLFSVFNLIFPTYFVSSSPFPFFKYEVLFFLNKCGFEI